MTNLVRLSFHSVRTDSSEQIVADILAQALQNNLRDDLTSCLFTYNDQYFQFIEGGRTAVLDRYERIKADPRHSNVQLDQLGEIDSRLFNRWSMATLSDSDVEEIVACRRKEGAGQTLFDSQNHDAVLAHVASLLGKRESRSNTRAQNSASF